MPQNPVLMLKHPHTKSSAFLRVQIWVGAIISQCFIPLLPLMKLEKAFWDCFSFVSVYLTLLTSTLLFHSHSCNAEVIIGKNVAETTEPLMSCTLLLLLGSLSILIISKFRHYGSYSLLFIIQRSMTSRVCYYKTEM